MTPFLIVAGMLVGLGATLVVAELLPHHPRLADVIQTTAPRLAPARVTTITGLVDDPGSPRSSRLKHRLGQWGEAHLAGLPYLSTPHDDLDVIGQSPRQFWAEKIIGFFGGLMLPQLATIAGVLLDLPIPAAIPAIVGLIFALILFLLPDRLVARQASAAREEFAAAVVAYVRLVAIRRLSRGGVTTSLTAAANVSDAWMFRRIREELLLAEWSGLTPWSALARLGQQLRVPELGEVADIMSLTEAGAAVAGSLGARAASMRDRQLTRELREANARTSQLVFPQTLLVGVFALTLTIPAVVILLGS